MNAPVNLRALRAAGRCSVADELAALAAQVARLSPDRRDPEAFHADKSEIACNLRRLARSLRRTP